MRAAHRAEVEQLLERSIGAGPLLERAWAALDEIAEAADAEYAAYVQAPGQERQRMPTGPVLVAAAGAVAAFAADLGLGASAGTAAGTAAAVAVVGAGAAVALRATGGAPERSPEQAREQARQRWLAAVEERGVRPFVERQGVEASAPAEAVPAAPAPAVKAVPAPRRTDRSAAARARSLLEQSFGHVPDVDGPFTGRKDQLRQISQWVHQARVSPDAGPVVVVLHGPSGSGRSALALHAARQLRDQFRGACVVDVRGAASDEPPLSTRDALLHLLNRFGAPREQLLFRERPSHEQHLRRLSEQYQKHLTGVPVIVVLNDATDPGLIRALVPRHSESLVLVTTAEPIDLPAPGARVHTLAVEPLDSDASYELLTAYAAPGSLDPRAAEEVRRLCGGLPLALRVAGSALGHRSVGRLAADLAVYGPQDPVDRALALRYHDQPDASRRLLRRLALAGRASLGGAAAAALLATDEQEADRRLRDLADAGLITHVRGSRYRLHDLVRSFAHDRLLDEEEPAERAAAHERLIRNYAELAGSVIRLVEGRTSTRADFSANAAARHGFTSLDLALRWLDDESSFITAALRHVEGVDQRAVQHLLGALCDYCVLRGDLYRLGEINDLAQRYQDLATAAGGGSSAQAPDSPALIRSVQWRTGIAARQLGELDKARSTLSSVVNLYFDAQHPSGAARALSSLGITLQQQGNLPEAEEKLREALALQDGDDTRGDRAWTLHALAAVVRDACRLTEARALLEESLVLHRESESANGQGWARLQFGQLLLRTGDVTRGEEQLHSAFDSFTATRDARGQAWATTQLARAQLLHGNPQAAAQQLSDALVRHRACEDARGEAWSLYYLGHTLEESGDLDAALRSLERSRTMFSRMRDVYGLACARHHSARVTRDQRAARTGNLRNSGFARQLLQDARQDFHRIGVPHGEAWTCLELAVIDAGNTRVPEALALTEQAEHLFASIGDRRGLDWSVFLQCTLRPLLSQEQAARARTDLAALLADTYEARDLDLEEYADAFALLLDRGIPVGSPWRAWELGMMPSRGARTVLAVAGA
ncbi:tetratricopeptide repeat protein [Streptomyces sp. NBC_01537]